MTLRRRELLAALVGAPLAFEACRRGPRHFPGSIRGAALELGHQLRGASSELYVEHAREPAERVRVAIVGAGPSGLCAAWRLERLGVTDYVVLDLEPRPGGTSASGGDGVVPYPWGAHYVPLPSPDNRALVSLLDEVGAIEKLSGGGYAARETALVRAPEERVFADGEWQEGLLPKSRLGAEEAAELARFERAVARLAELRDARGRRAFALPLSNSSDDAELLALDRISAKAWLLRNGYETKLFHWYVEYACRDDYGLSLERTSAWAMLFYFAARATRPGESAPFLTWPEGNGRLVQHLAKIAGQRLRLGSLVSDVVPGEHGVSLAALDARGGVRRIEAEHVILAVPKFVAQRIVRPFRDQRPGFLSEFRYTPWLVANLHLAGRPRSRGFPFAWDNVLLESLSLGYVVATHQTLSDFGRTIWTYYRPFAEDEPGQGRKILAETDQTAAASAIMADLERAHPDLAHHIERIDVFRWGHAMVAPVPGFLFGGARKRAQEPLGRIRFAHSDLSGLALFEEAQYWGVRAAEEVARACGRSFEPL